jgi:hypothetical protein
MRGKANGWAGKRLFGSVAMAFVALSFVGADGCDVMPASSSSSGDDGGSTDAGTQGTQDTQGSPCGTCPRQVPQVGGLCLQPYSFCNYPQANAQLGCSTGLGWRDVTSFWSGQPGVESCPAARPTAGTPCVPNFMACTVCEYAQGCRTPITTMLCDRGTWVASPDDAVKPRMDPCGGDYMPVDPVIDAGNDVATHAGYDASNDAPAHIGMEAGNDAGTHAGPDAAGDVVDHAAFCKSCLNALSNAHPGCKFYYPSLAGWGLCMECPDGTVPYRFIDVPGGGTAFTPPGHEGGQCPNCSPSP